jgi:putative N6-adenine-specific DNA methylase
VWFLDAADYGAPQTRTRVILCASRHGLPTMPVPTHGPGRLPYRTLGEVFGTHWAGWRAFVFTSNDWLARKIDRKVKSSVPFFNGKLQCKLWEFDTTR